MQESISAFRGEWDGVRERAQFEQQLALDRTYIIASHGLDVGFVTILPRGGRLHIYTLCTAPEHQGGGIGSGVIRHVVANGLGSGRDIVLSVLKPNRRAQALYERLGFVVVGETEHHRHLRYGSKRRGV
jgi:ribosomal protein S18 acetylase RimI-like enzyme